MNRFGALGKLNLAPVRQSPRGRNSLRSEITRSQSLLAQNPSKRGPTDESPVPIKDQSRCSVGPRLTVVGLHVRSRIPWIPHNSFAVSMPKESLKRTMIHPRVSHYLERWCKQYPDDCWALTVRFLGNIPPRVRWFPTFPLQIFSSLIVRVWSGIESQIARLLNSETEIINVETPDLREPW